MLLAGGVDRLGDAPGEGHDRDHGVACMLAGVNPLAEWARVQGLHPQTAYCWYRNGTLPVPAVRVGSSTILVNPEVGPSRAVSGAGLYARVSSS